MTCRNNWRTLYLFAIVGTQSDRYYPFALSRTLTTPTPYPSQRYCARSEITIVVLLPPTVTITCIGKAPSGTAAATKVLVSLLNVSQLGSGCPFAVVTTMGALLPAAKLSACAGSVKLKPLPVVAISLGTETVMMPDCCNVG